MPKFHNLAMFLDVGKAGGSVIRSFEAAYCQYCCNLIIPRIIIFNKFVDEKYEIKLKNLDQWLIYTTNTYDFDFFVFIPKNSLSKDFDKKNEIEQESDIGFNVNSKDQILEKFDTNIFTPIKNEELEKKRKSKIKILKSEANLNSNINIQIIKKIFINPQDSPSIIWNILLNGHGSYAKNLINQPIIEKNITAEFLATSKARIAGLPILNFIDLLSFFSNPNNINVNFLYYRSCFAGGVNLLLPFMNIIYTSIDASTYKPIKLLRQISNQNFIIAASGLTDTLTEANSIKTLRQCTNNNMDLGLQNYRLFFNLLSIYSKNKKFKNKELKEILAAITPISKNSINDPYGISAMPNVLFPNSEKFVAMPLNDKIFVITDAMATGIIFRDQPLETLDINNKEAILLYPYYLRSNLNIIVETGAIPPALISMKPFTALHKIEEININITFSDFVKNLFRATVFTKFFYIKKLILINDKNCIPYKPLGKEIVLSNVFIQIVEKDEKIYISIIFTDDNNKDIWSNYYYTSKNKKQEQIKVGPSKKSNIKVLSIIKNELINSFINYFNRQIDLTQNFNYYILETLLDQNEQIFLKNEKYLTFLDNYLKFYENYNKFVFLLYKIKDTSNNNISTNIIQDLLSSFTSTLINAINLEKIILQTPDIGNEINKDTILKQIKIVQDKITNFDQLIIQELPILNHVSNINMLFNKIYELLYIPNTDILKEQIGKLIKEIKFFNNSNDIINYLNNIVNNLYKIVNNEINNLETQELSKEKLKSIILKLNIILSLNQQIEKLEKKQIITQEVKSLQNLLQNKFNLKELADNVSQLEHKLQKIEFIHKNIYPIIDKMDINE